MKKYLIIAVIAIAVGASAGAVNAIHSKSEPVAKTSQTLHFTDDPVTTETTEVETTEETSTNTVTTTPTETPAEAPVVLDIHAEAKQLIGDDTQYACFDQAMQYRYGWDVDETKMLEKLNYVKENYTSFCTLWSRMKVVNQNAPLYMPDGFRD